MAISSASFAGSIAAGNLTQLEWLEGCASALGADGIVFARAHFPRMDAEYIAQLRKVAIDLGLVPLGVEEPNLFGLSTAAGISSADRLTSAGHVGFASAEAPTSTAGVLTSIDLAFGIGGLFVLTALPPPGDVPPAAFVAAVAAAKEAVRAAKAVNVTLLVRAAPATLAEDVPALRHFRKDVDSAWLRYALPAGADRASLGARDRALVVTVDPGADLDALAEIEESARPWLLLTGEVSAERVSALRRAVAKKTLAAASSG